jgi:hypothetical protein
VAARDAAAAFFPARLLGCGVAADTEELSAGVGIDFARPLGSLKPCGLLGTPKLLGVGILNPLIEIPQQPRAALHSAALMFKCKLQHERLLEGLNLVELPCQLL